MCGHWSITLRVCTLEESQRNLLHGSRGLRLNEHLVLLRSAHAINFEDETYCGWLLVKVGVDDVLWLGVFRVLLQVQYEVNRKNKLVHVLL